MNQRMDFHVHTSCSDGQLSPKEVIDKALQNQVSVLSITDHDTTQAYTDSLFSYAKEKGIQLIPGVEISTKYKKVGIHVLGYHIRLDDKHLLTALKSLRNARHDYLYQVTKKLNQLGYQVHFSKLDEIEAVTKAHISSDIIQNLKNQKQLLQDFGYIPEKGEFIETIMNEGCPAYAKKKTITPKEAADLIRLAGGVVVLAHPVAYKYEDGFTNQDILDLVKEMKPDGIEAIYLYINRNHQKINESNDWITFAQIHHLKISMGSDFHKEDGIHPTIGLSHENFLFDPLLFEWLTEGKKIYYKK